MLQTNPNPLAVFGQLGRAEIRDAIRAERCRRSLESFVRAAWAIHHPATPLHWAWHMGAIAEHLQAVSAGEIRKLLINVPPGFCKSLMVSVYWPAWEWASQPHLQYLVTGAVSDVVLRDARRMHEIVSSPWYQQTFLPDWGWDRSQDAKGYFVNSAGGFRVSRTCGQKITGLRGDRRIWDDPLDANDAFADKAALEDTNVWLDTVFSTRKNSPDSPEVGIMQRLHERDPSGHVLEQGGWVHLCLPNEYDGEKHYTILGYQDPREEQGELLCPAICDAEETARQKKILSRVGYAGQYQQAPVPAEGIIFREEFFKEWDRDNLPKFDLLIGSWDFNDLKRKRPTTDTDYVCGQVWGAAGPDRYLLAQYREKIGLLKSKEKVKEQVERWSEIRRVLIEGKANGPSIIAALSNDPALARLVESIPVQGESKIQRAVACTPAVEGGHVYIPPRNLYPWVREVWIPEICGFPNRRRDDQVDAMTMALIWLTLKRRRGLWSASAG